MKNFKLTMMLTLLVSLFFTLSVSAQTSNTKSNVAILQSGYESFAKGDVPAVLAILDSKVEWNEAENFIYGNNKTIVGHDAIVNEVFMKLGTEWENFRIVNLQLINMDNGMVLATGRYQGKYKKNGAVVDAQMAHVWTLNDGKVIKFQQYTDTKQFVEAIKK
jgi:ketosteroid isomerase-like protein